MQNLNFGSLLLHYRKKAGLSTLSQFADALSDVGLLYSESLLSRWQKNNRLPKDRQVYLLLLKILIEKHAINNIFEANQLLASANMGFLSSSEVLELIKTRSLSFDHTTFNMPYVESKLANHEQSKADQVRVSLLLPKKLHDYLSWVASEYKLTQSEVCRRIIDKNISLADQN